MLQFSTRLASLALNCDPAEAIQTKVSVDGPYGELSLSNWRTDYQHMILCGGGSGVTPMMSMIGELMYMKANGQLGHVQSVHLIWVASNVDPIRDWFPAQLRQIRDAVCQLSIQNNFRHCSSKCTKYFIFCF